MCLLMKLFITLILYLFNRVYDYKIPYLKQEGSILGRFVFHFSDLN